ncbi:hypothetical protein BV25DRAFT_504161 [Artomyces pyxidatus]|uniref:Uncharacterized protein n=1 Tax=Artomyces pyxidatus TaxID=48021 RepID=A0ACB8THW9_9AGAM|nr:hypothetical protein BV25DRAFT_504161 [Artomyces pyxidatus]
MQARGDGADPGPRRRMSASLRSCTRSRMSRCSIGVCAPALQRQMAASQAHRIQSILVDRTPASTRTRHGSTQLAIVTPAHRCCTYGFCVRCIQSALYSEQRDLIAGLAGDPRPYARVQRGIRCEETTASASDLAAGHAWRRSRVLCSGRALDSLRSRPAPSVDDGASPGSARSISVADAAWICAGGRDHLRSPCAPRAICPHAAASNSSGCAVRHAQSPLLTFTRRSAFYVMRFTGVHGAAV